MRVWVCILVSGLFLVNLLSPSQGVGPAQNDAGSGGDAGDLLALATAVPYATFSGMLEWQVDGLDFYRLSVPGGRATWLNVTSSADIWGMVWLLEDSGPRRVLPVFTGSNVLLAPSDAEYVLMITPSAAQIPGKPTTYTVDVASSVPLEIAVVASSAARSGFEARWDEPGVLFRRINTYTAESRMIHDGPVMISADESNLHRPNESAAPGGGGGGSIRYGHGDDIRIGTLGLDVPVTSLSRPPLPIGFSVGAYPRHGTVPEASIHDGPAPDGRYGGGSSHHAYVGSLRSAWAAESDLRVEVVIGSTAPFTIETWEDDRPPFVWRPEKDIEAPGLHVPYHSNATFELGSSFAGMFIVTNSQRGEATRPDGTDQPLFFGTLVPFFRPMTGNWSFEVESTQTFLNQRPSAHFFGFDLPDLGIYEGPVAPGSPQSLEIPE